MSPASRTLAFVLTAVCFGGVALATHFAYRPAPQSAIDDVGTEFFPDFNPSSASFLSVAAYNSKTSKTDTFAVEKKDGEWRIPSHHNYPADGKDRLFRTAASLIGVKRGQLVDKSAESHQRLNLIDPLDKKATGTEGRGNRITLKAGDAVLTDLIVGKKEEGQGAERYYVRRADEPRVYLAEIHPDLSTKFVDWIQPNLLDATGSNFREMVLDRYQIDEDKGALVQGEKSVLERTTSTDEWKLRGIADDKKVKTSVVNAMVSSLTDMKIVGVRPKPSGLGASLKGDGDARLSPIDQMDMQDKGFFITRDGGLKSKEGDFLAGTADGVIYVLRFGSVISGDDVDIEIGDSKKRTEEEAKAALEAKKKPDEPKKDDTKPGEERKENRYVFVSVQFDEGLLGEAPVEPVKPTPPPGYVPPKKPETPEKPSAAIPGFTKPEGEKAPETKPDAAAPKADAPKKETSAIVRSGVSLAGPGADAPQDEKKEPATPATTETKPAAEPATPPAAETKPAAEKPADAKPAADPAAPPAAGEKPVVTPAVKDPVAEYEEALRKYEQAMDEYKVKKADYDEKLKKGKDREKFLNTRFADWYYVIPADVFNTLNVKATELVEPKDAPKAEGAGGPPAGLGGFPGLPPGLLGQPSAPPKAEEAAKPAAKTEEPAKPATDDAKAAPKADDAKSADAPKGDEAAKPPADAPKKD